MPVDLQAESNKLSFLHSPDGVAYTILSHNWADGEVLFRDLDRLETASSKLGWKKVDYMCRQTIRDGLEWTWIDTCCIDKSSSAELSEAINSMFTWYHSATICHVYLGDFQCTIATANLDNDSFRRCRWWHRGWTLQELFAPCAVSLWDQKWNYLGMLEDIAELAPEITHVDLDVLLGITLPADVCIARRLSWAASRKTTRLEDEAYALLGILNINMPVIYGEGRGAFQRLQEIIMRKSSDLTILAWAGALCSDAKYSRCSYRH
ncbi:HET-domain-containing protein [Teratosphaeria nubilosa]|uniref:HET-domain-containing protein n=1 Tax=Teratosphaeria nubilosa TaxID=161662 RepID=A0A6G1L5Q4_9PEZI|nr:HET-domain-containing protein [Teratosphaeria nubilosa]